MPWVSGQFFQVYSYPITILLAALPGETKKHNYYIMLFREVYVLRQIEYPITGRSCCFLLAWSDLSQSTRNSTDFGAPGGPLASGRNTTSLSAFIFKFCLPKPYVHLSRFWLTTFSLKEILELLFQADFQHKTHKINLGSTDLVRFLFLFDVRSTNTLYDFWIL